MYDYGVERTNLSDSEQMLRGIVKVTVVASEPLPAPLELSFNYYWTSVYTDDPYSPERHSDTYTLSLKAGARGTSQYLFDAGREMLRQPIYHIDGYYTRDGFMVVEGGGMTVTSVSEPPVRIHVQRSGAGGQVPGTRILTESTYNLFSVYNVQHETETHK